MGSVKGEREREVFTFLSCPFSTSSSFLISLIASFLSLLLLLFSGCMVGGGGGGGDSPKVSYKREKERRKRSFCLVFSRMKEGILFFDWAKIIFLGSSIRSHVPIFFIKNLQKRQQWLLGIHSWPLLCVTSGALVFFLRH